MSGLEVTMPELLAKVVELGASDLHLKAGSRPSLRLQGEIEFIQGQPVLQPDDVKGLAFSLVREDQRKTLEQKRELDFAYTQKGLGRFRCNIGYQQGSLFVSIRRLYDKIPSPSELLLPVMMSNIIMLDAGLVIVTGPTGSGKTTTLASLVHEINNRRKRHIITIEDPIEYIHDDNLCIIEQRELGADTLGFATAIKHAMRQDPDVIVVGEMRDLDTISAAITAAETGHLVFATLHTKNVPLTLDRIIDVFPEGQQSQVRTQLAGALECVLSQRLVPQIGGEGRVAIFEAMRVIPAIRNLIRENKVEQIHSTIMTHGRTDGMVTMDQCLAERYLAEMITRETAMGYAVKPGDVDTMIRQRRSAAG